MKKYSVLLLLSLLLGACGNEVTEPNEKVDNQVTMEKVEETEPSISLDSQEAEKAVPETSEVAEARSPKETTELKLTNENIKEVVEFNGTGEGDELISSEIVEKEVRAVINLAPSDLLPADQLAVTRYSQVSDELLNYENWETLKVEYVDIGTISMQRSETETNEWGMTYFPSEVIDSKLN